MQTLSPALSAHLQAEVTSLATCWQLTLRDGTIMGFTDYSSSITIEERVYEAQTGFTPSAIVSTNSFAVDNLDIEGMIDSDVITREDIIAGRFDFAELEVFMVNYQDVSQGLLSLKRGWLGELSLSNGKFVAEVRGLTAVTASVTGNLYTPSCRVKFGDNSCKLNLEAYTVIGEITGIISNRIFSDSSREEENGYFTNGKITFTSGANTGLTMEVKEYSTDSIMLVLPMPYPVETGDGYSMIAGCDKSFSTCITRFDNAVNFRAEPHVPGMDRMLQTAATS